MKTFYFFIFLLACGCTETKAQQLVVDSTRFIAGTSGHTFVDYTIPTIDKGLLLVGRAEGKSVGIIPPFPIDTTNVNVLIIKIDSNQQFSWIKVYGGSGDDFARCAVQTSDGGYAVVASTSSTDGDITGFKGASDIWLLRLDASGNLLWQKTYGGPGGDGCISVANAVDGGFVILGMSDHAGGDVPLHYGDEFDLDWLVIKTDDIGNKQWSKTIGGTDRESYDGSIFAIDSAYYLAGSSASKDHDCYDTAWHSGLATLSDYHLLKIDWAGTLLWDKSYGGGLNEGIGNAMFDTRDSTILMVGSTNSNDYMVTGLSAYSNIWVTKINKAGGLQWQKTMGNGHSASGSSICTTADNGYMVLGYTSPGPLPPDNLLFALDAAGAGLCTKLFGGSGYDVPYCVVPYLSGYAVTGYSASSVFTEGSNYGRLGYKMDGFISYINYWPLTVDNIPLPGRELSLYPNPAQNKVRVRLSNNAATGLLTVMDVAGRVAFTTNVNKYAEYVDVSTQGWIRGSYIVRWVCADGSVLTGKLTVM